MLMPALVRTPCQHESTPFESSQPQDVPNSDLPVAGLQQIATPPVRRSRVTVANDLKKEKKKENILSGVGFEPTHTYVYQSLNLAP